MHSIHPVGSIPLYKCTVTNVNRYVLDIGQSQDWLALQISMAPCLIGYGVIARRLYNDPKTKREGNIYWKWIQAYVADDYTEAVETGTGKLALLLYLQKPLLIVCSSFGEKCCATIS